MMPITLNRRTGAIVAIIAIALVFFALRLPGVHLPFHQDEWKNVSTAETMAGAWQFYAHPPLFGSMFVLAYNIFGPDNIRWFTVIISTLSAITLYFVVKGRADAKSGVWAVILYSVCIYAIWGALQPDVEGAVLPFLLLLSVLAYDRGWKTLLVAALLIGMLVKLSFILVIGAIVIDYLWANRRDQVGKKFGYALIATIVFGAVYVGLLYLIQSFSGFSISFMLDHARQVSSADGGRGWGQIAVQTVKAVYYLSPLLLVPLIWLTRAVMSKTRVFWFYLLFGVLFHLVIFDFSQGALDKYLMFLIVPLAAICGIIFRNIFKRLEYSSADTTCDSLKDVFNVVCYGRGRAGFIGSIVVGVVVSLIIVSVNFFPQIVTGLYPKSEWFSNVLHGHWNVLTPFTGGSGPMGFYISFLFIALSFIVCIVVALIGRSKKETLVTAAAMVFIIGLSYNLVFAEELFYGRINGSAPQVARELASYVVSHPEIKEVITYNDIGAQLLGDTYAGRFYAAPQFEEGHRDKFAKFSGYYMIVDIPHLYETGFYAQFFATCRSVKSTTSGRIVGHIYECGKTATK